MEEKQERVNVSQEELDFVIVATLSKRIGELANKAVELHQKLFSENLSEDDRELVETEYKTIVQKGCEASEEMRRIYSQYS